MRQFRSQLESRISSYPKTEIWYKLSSGTYQGQMRSNKPHGLGRWTCNSCDIRSIKEAQWADGQLHGKVVNDGFRLEFYEATRGVIHGKLIAYQDDTRIEVESHFGAWHGIQRKFKDGRMESEEIYNNGRKM